MVSQDEQASDLMGSALILRKLAKESNGMRVLMLVSDAHGGFGGIAQYNRDVLEAMSRFVNVKEILVLPRLADAHDFWVPDKVTYDLGGIAGKPAYFARCIRHVFDSQIDLVYCAHINLLPVAAFIARVRGAPLVLAIYGIESWWRPTSHIVAYSVHGCDHVISISRVTLDRFLSWHPMPTTATSIAPNAIHASKYGLGTENAELVEQHGLKGRKVIMTLGRIASAERYKGFDEVIEVLPRLRERIPNIIYLVVGDGPDRSRLEAKSRQLGVSELVVFVGRVPEERKADYYRLADAYVMPSSGEGFGFVILEALACGLPVVASSADGTREALQEGKLGLVVNPKESTALESAILTCLDRPKQVPQGLEYFSFRNFEQRLAAILTLVGRGAMRKKDKAMVS